MASEEDFSLLSEEQKAKILFELQEEIEKQKAKYIFNKTTNTHNKINNINNHINNKDPNFELNKKQQKTNSHLTSELISSIDSNSNNNLLGQINILENATQSLKYIQKEIVNFSKTQKFEILNNQINGTTAQNSSKSNQNIINVKNSPIIKKEDNINSLLNVDRIIAIEPTCAKFDDEYNKYKNNGKIYIKKENEESNNNKITLDQSELENIDKNKVEFTGLKRKNSVLNDSKNISHRIKNEITPILNYKDKTIKRNISSKCDAFYKSRKSSKNNISNGNNKITINNLSNHKNNNSNGQTNKNIKNKYLKKANSFTNQYVNKNNEKPLNENYLKKISNNHIPKYKNKNARNSKSKKNSSILKTELELITKFKEDHPFKPKINTQYNKNLKPETNKDRFTRLSRPKSSTQVIIKTKNNFDENKKINSKKTSERLYKLHDQIKAKKKIKKLKKKKMIKKKKKKQLMKFKK